jgi:hypothetical protein
MPLDQVTEIYDISGRLLFRDLIEGLTDDLEMVIRTVADAHLGTPVWSMRIVPRQHWKTLVDRALDTSGAKGLSFAGGKPKVVCYSYPKLAVEVADTDGRACLIDIADHSIVRPSEPPKPRFSESRFLWSPFDFVHRAIATSRLETFRRGAASLIAGPLSESAIAEVVPPRESPEGLETIPECGGSTTALNCMRWVPQEAPDYCTLASAQMILAFHGISVTQQQLAQIMGISPSDDGASIDQQMLAYRTLSRGILTPNYDPTPTFDEAREEVHAGRPLKSGIPGHARVCAGWSFRVMTDGSVVKWLRIFDPWPDSEPNIYWENGMAIVHTNYIYVRRLVR